ncbi:hypothetical protein BGX26_008326 [Mortierella sp. AD094]|nr:hypothetical protein BGX26_008326 [Mortierella sp. AD094]
MYKEEQKTHYSQSLVGWHLPKGYMDLKTNARFPERQAAVQEYNKLSKWRKHSLIPIKYGIGFSVMHLNQAGAVVHICHDGSVPLSHGGVEIGQGLYTKMIQLCAEVLNIPMDLIRTVDTSLGKVANSASTAASISTDPNDAVFQAYFDRVKPSANGFYKILYLGHDWETNSSQLLCYFTIGAAISEVEVDILTRTHTVLHSGVSMDLGRPINPTMDIGQIKDAFIQGACEIPGFRCIPQEFNVSFFEDVANENLKTIYRSKGAGEPPLFLGSSVYLQENGRPGTFSLPISAASEKIRMAAGDSIAESSKL